MKTKTELRVRHYECDIYGHVNNAVYLNYLEVARGDFLDQIGFDYNGFIKAGYSIFVVSLTINYKSSAYADDTLKIFTEPIKSGKATGVFKQEIYVGDRLICDAMVKWASIGDSGRPMAIPKEWFKPGLNPDA